MGDTTRDNFQAEMEKDRKVHVSVEPGANLGCEIGKNEEWGPGIFVQRVNKGSVSDTLGFKVGDQVIEVNGVSFLDIGHEEAVMNLTTSRHLTVILRSREHGSHHQRYNDEKGNKSGGSLAFVRDSLPYQRAHYPLHGMSFGKFASVADSLPYQKARYSPATTKHQ